MTSYLTRMPKIEEYEGGKRDVDSRDQEILSLTSSSPLTLEELCQRLSIPSNECFSRVRRLESKGLLERTQECENVCNTAVRVRNLYKAIKK